jgi:hypothetical protein
MRIVLLVFLSVCSLTLNARLRFGMQTGLETQFQLPKDSIADTLPKKKLTPPKKAAIMSACLPGLGQAYDHFALGVRYSWIKIPIIYAGFGGLAYGFAWNQNYVAKYRDALRLRYDDDSTTIDQFSTRYTDNDLVTLKNYYQRYRDLCVIGMAALYTLQILDATVDAHLATFDVSDNLSMQISPRVLYAGGTRAPGIGVRLQFR